MTGDGGADRFVFKAAPWTAGHITDFVHGTDKIDVSTLLANAHYAGSNAVADGYLKLVDNGAGSTWLYFDSDGTGSADPWGSFLTTVDKVSPSGLSLSDFIV
jgi:hypothetical protein